jgi:hypothetical protein
LLSVELVESETDESKKAAYYETIKLSATKIELSIKEMCAFIDDLNSDAAAERETLAKENLDSPVDKA